MVTLEQLKSWLRIEDDAQDEELARLLARTIDFIQRDLDWYFGPPRQTTEFVSGLGIDRFFLRQPPVISAEHPFVVTGRSNVGVEWITVESTEYEVADRQIIGFGPWPVGTRNLQIAYWEGFVVTPGEIEQLILDLATIKWRGRGLNPEMQSETIGDYSYTRADTDKLGHGAWSNIKNRWRRGRI